MTVNELYKRFSFESLCTPDSERKISGAYCGDLLSWVMGHAQSGDAWITIMSNINTVAVASLADVSCIILAEGVKPESDVIKTAEEKGINILSSSKSVYEISVLLGSVL